MDLFFADSSGPSRPLPWEPGRGDALVVCPDDLSLWRCRKLGLPGFLLNEEVAFIRGEAWDAVIGPAVRLARSWYRDPDGADFTVYRDISLGRLLEGESWNEIFGRIFKFAEEASRLAAERRPQTVWAAGGLPAYKKAVLESLCRRDSLELRWDAPDRPCRKDRGLSRGCAWPLSAHAGKRRLLNLGLRGLGRKRGKRVIASYYFTLWPLIAGLGVEPGIEPVFYDWPGRRLAGLPGWRNWRFMTAPRGAGLHAEGRRRLAEMRERFDVLSRSPRYREDFRFEGLDCWEAARQRLAGSMEEDFPVMADAAEKVGAALDAQPPDLVVVPYDGSPSEILLIEAARRRGVPSAIVLHGIPCCPRIAVMDTSADYLLVWGPELVDLYAEVGYPRERILTTGHPMLDVLASRRRRARPPGGPTRVLVVSGYGAIELGIGKVLDVLARFDGIDVTVRPHPGESVEAYKSVLAGRLGQDRRLEWRRSLGELLPDADLVVSHPSTALVEAMAMGIPVVTLNIERVKLPPPFCGGNGLSPIESFEGLEGRLRELLPDRVPASEDYSRFLDAFAGRPDGRCVRRCLDALLGLMRR